MKISLKKTAKMRLITGAAACAMMLFTGTAAIAAPVPSLCSVQNCNITTSHDHDGITYGGHHYGDGHDYHEYCNISGCTEDGAHTHGDHSYIGCHRQDGNGTDYYAGGRRSGGCHGRHGGRHH